jgi:hypothetical protein
MSTTLKVRISKVDVEQLALLTLDAGPTSHEGVLNFKCEVSA